MLKPECLNFLRTHKNLLAFSGGSDSSALFFLLLHENIDFDIALVNYNTRKQSGEEEAYALDLAKKYHKKCHIRQVHLSSSNFEHQARQARYDFFESLIQEHTYTALLTAHHLGDRLEWFFMQLTKGAGLPELLGMQAIMPEENYSLVRPLLHIDKSALSNYLQKHDIHFFKDESNDDERYKRNHFRHHYAQPLLESYAKGIAESFAYLDQDSTLLIESSHYDHSGEMYYFKTHQTRRSTLVLLDKIIKQCGYMMSSSEKLYLMEKSEHIVGRNYAVMIGENYTVVTPYLENIVMSKSHKEACRVLGIGGKLRPYLFKDNEAFATLSKLIKENITS